jgi:hypothetical protein
LEILEKFMTSQASVALMPEMTLAAAENDSPLSFASFEEFYPFYLSQHQDKTCKRLHFVGSSLGLLGLGAAVVTGKKRYIAAGIVAGYGCAWVGHFFFEHNKPATFQYPLYSFMGDWVMYKDMVTGKIPL